jgi:hypothetical protein
MSSDEPLSDCTQKLDWFGWNFFIKFVQGISILNLLGLFQEPLNAQDELNIYVQGHQKIKTQ